MVWIVWLFFGRRDHLSEGQEAGDVRFGYVHVLMAGVEETEVGEGEDGEDSAGQIRSEFAEAHVHSTDILQLLAEGSRNLRGKQERRMF